MKHRFRSYAIAAALIALFALSRHVVRAADVPASAAKDPYDRSNVPIEVQPTDPKAVKIVIIAGDAGVGHPPGDHEHFAGCALLMRMLQQTPGVAPVMAKDGWPTNPETLKNARTIVFYMDGGGKQTTIAHADEIQKLMDAGVGIVHLHQVIDYPTEAGKQAMQWLGGVYEPKTGARGHWDESFTTFVDHEITRGVTPFKLNDGWILKLRFIPEMKGITPLLRTTQLSPKPKPDEKITGSDNIVCWAYERLDGGRAFVLTGAHGHKNWGLIGLRKLVVNGILWSAKVAIPKDGAPVELDPADLMTNMERKPVKKAAKAVGIATPKTDMDRIQGIWDVVSADENGKTGVKYLRTQSLEFEGDHAYSLKGTERGFSTIFRLDASHTPAHIDMLADDPGTRKAVLGIYELAGDLLRIANMNPGDERPADFQGRRGLVVSLKRRANQSQSIPQATKVAQETTADFKRLQGIWLTTGTETDGKADPAQEASRVEVVGNELYLLDARGRSRFATIRLDATQKPAHIDIWSTDEEKSRSVDRGIYELYGDYLKVCTPRVETLGADLPNRPDTRPKAFDAENTSTLNFQREKKRSPADPGKEPAPEKEIPAKEKKSDADLLRGIWDIASFSHDGESDTLEFAVEFDGNHAYRIVDGKRTNPVTLKLDSSQHPAQIDITLGEDADDNGKLLGGIYELKGDELKLCLRFTLLGNRPTTFSPQGTELLTLKRRPKGQ